MSEGSYTEDHLVEQPAIELMQHELGWDVVNCYGEWDSGASSLGRDGKREVVLMGRLKPALRRLNPDLPVEAIEGAVEEICRDRTALSLAEANREIDKLLKQGVKVSFPDPEHGGQRVEVVSVVDWEVPENNDFLLGSQFWVADELYLTEAIKKVCKDLLAQLKTELLVLAWRTKRTTRAAVELEIAKMLDAGLPEKYTVELYEQKRGVLFQHVLEKYPESGESVYQTEVA